MSKETEVEIKEMLYLNAMSSTELLDAVGDETLRQEMQNLLTKCILFHDKVEAAIRTLSNIEDNFGYALDLTDELLALRSVRVSVRRKQRNAFEQIAVNDERSALAV